MRLLRHVQCILMCAFGIISIHELAKYILTNVFDALSDLEEPKVI